MLEAAKSMREETGCTIADAQVALHLCLGHRDLAVRWLQVRGAAVACAPGMHPTAAVEREAKSRGHA